MQLENTVSLGDTPAKFNALAMAVRGSVLRRIERWGILFADPAIDVTATAEAFTANDQDVRYAEPDVRVIGLGLTPTDEFYGDQWGMARIDAENAWCVHTGEGNVLIGVVDAGIVLDGGIVKHSDFTSGRFTLGTDWIDGGLPEDESYNDHGTAVTGVIAAEGDTSPGGWGIAGMNWASPVYVTRVLDDSAMLSGSTGDVYSAVSEILDVAVARGFRCVINLSLGLGSSASADDLNTLKDMCALVEAADAIAVCAAGNDGAAEIDAPAYYSPDYPDHVIAVGATTQDKGEFAGGTIHDDEWVWNGSNYSDRLTVVAPGHKILTTESNNYHNEHNGTSFAAPHVAGLVSLIWSAYPDVAPGEVISLIKNTAWKPGSVAAGDTYWGSGRIDAGAALARLSWAIEMLTPTSIQMSDVPDGATAIERIQLEVLSCVDVALDVRVSGDDFGVAAGTYTHAGSDTTTGSVFELELTYTASAALPAAAGQIDIEWRDGATILGKWSVYVTANRAGDAAVVFMIVADKSGSMASDSGIASYPRMEVLQYSTDILVQTLMRDADAAGIVAFDSAAGLVGPAYRILDSATARNSVTHNMGGLVADGSTSIGAGVQEAQRALDEDVPADALAGDEARAIIVVTDGHENFDPMVDDIIDTITTPVYAIAMGTPEVIQPDSLESLTSATGGYGLITGALDDESEFTVAKYYAQITADISGDSVVLDPGARILPKQLHEYRFPVARTERRIDIITMMPLADSGIFEVTARAPWGASYRSSEAGDIDGVDYAASSYASRFRITLPVQRHDDPGEWRVALEVRADMWRDYITRLGEDEHRIYKRSNPWYRFWFRPRTTAPYDVEDAQTHGVRYNMLVHARSDVRIRSRLHQSGHSPGSKLVVTVDVTQGGVPLDRPSNVVAWLDAPDRRRERVGFTRESHGGYGRTIVADRKGVYRLRIVVTGVTRAGDRFRRESVVTGAIW